MALKKSIMLYLLNLYLILNIDNIVSTSCDASFIYYSRKNSHTGIKLKNSNSLKKFSFYVLIIYDTIYLSIFYFKLKKNRFQSE